MAITVNSNVSALTAQRNLSKSGAALTTSMERLSSGSKINSAKDDAAGLQISNRLNSQIKGLNVAMKNASDGISMAQTAEGAMQESTNMLQRMRELALQSTNGSNSDADRQSLQEEFNSLSGELTRIAKTTSFGGRNLLDGSFGSTAFQVGANANQTVTFGLGDVSSSALKGSYSNASADGAATDLSAKVVGNTGAISGDAKVAGTAAFKTHVFSSADAGDLSLVGEDIAVVAGDTIHDVVNKINSNTTVANALTASVNDVGQLALAYKGNYTIGAGTSATTTALGLTAGAQTGDVTGTAGLDGKLGAAGAGTLIIGSSAIALESSDSLDDMLSKINAQSSNTGVTASADKDGKLLLNSKGDFNISAASTPGTLTTLGMAAGDKTATTGLVSEKKITLNDTDFTFAAGSTLNDVVTMINNNGGTAGSGTTATGVTASADNGRLVLTSADGKNIELEDKTGGSLQALGLSAGETKAKLAEATSITLNGTEIKFNKDDDLDAIISSINTASTGATASKNDDGILKLHSEKDIIVADGAKGTGLASLGLTAATTKTVTQEATVSNLNIDSVDGSQTAIQVLDGAISQIDGERSKLGATQNRFNSTINNLANVSENAAAGMARIMDVDFAQETVNLTKQQILQQAGTSILAQAKQIPQAALSLLG
ncbi:flagellin [Oceanisphaera profunda]|uniref:Flagellin n=1 Tax=Oceanisphaera profunda TaxID=1416627 RepID=A0A1Y0D844_9GAMM|nr:flagellin [Oceanisphaera profunda]